MKLTERYSLNRGTHANLLRSLPVSMKTKYAPGYLKQQHPTELTGRVEKSYPDVGLDFVQWIAKEPRAG